MLTLLFAEGSCQCFQFFFLKKNLKDGKLMKCRKNSEIFAFLLKAVVTEGISL